MKKLLILLTIVSLVYSCDVKEKEMLKTNFNSMLFKAKARDVKLNTSELRKEFLRLYIKDFDSVTIFVTDLSKKINKAIDKVKKEQAIILKGIRYELFDANMVKANKVLNKTQMKLIATKVAWDKKRALFFHAEDMLNAGEDYASYHDGLVITYPAVHREPIPKKKRIFIYTLDKFESKVAIISREFVKQRLKSPKSADFPSYDYTVLRYDGNTYFIKSYVDSKNAYNAEIRTNYTALIEYKGGEWSNSGNWKLKELKFE